LEKSVLSTSNNNKLSQDKCLQHFGDLFGYNNIALQQSIPSLLPHFEPEGVNLLKIHGGGTRCDLHTMSDLHTMKCLQKNAMSEQQFVATKNMAAILHPPYSP